MSAGGQNSSSTVGITGMRIRDTADVVAQTRVRQIYQLFNSSTPNAIRPRIPNANDVYLQYLQGTKEVTACTACAGLAYNGTGLVLKYRNGNFPPV